MKKKKKKKKGDVEGMPMGGEDEVEIWKMAEMALRGENKKPTFEEWRGEREE